MARRKPNETPLMRQYLEMKAQQPDGLVFFRCGDFYEMFFEDAVITAKKLDLTLTSRDKGRDDAIPMCGVPHHAVRGYIARLTELGHKVVLVEQIEDPKLAKGLVKRAISRIITPGVVLDDEVLDPKTGRYLAGVSLPVEKDQGFGLAYLDASTGEFRATQMETLDALIGELSRVAPSEVLLPPVPDNGAAAVRVQQAEKAVRERVPDAVYNKADFSDPDKARGFLDGPECDGIGQRIDGPALGDRAATAAAAVLGYARGTQPSGTLPLTRMDVYSLSDAVVLDEAAVANLELVRTLMGGKKAGSLLSVIDKTCTATGGRRLRRWLLYPLTSVDAVRRRQDAVQYLLENSSLRGELREHLSNVGDLERLAGKVSLRVANPRDLGRLRDSIQALPALIETLQTRVPGGELVAPPEVLSFDPLLLEELSGLAADLALALADDPPVITRDGGYIRDGYCETVDENRALANGGKSEILAIEERERASTGIARLRVKYNRVFGYYLEVAKSQGDLVPEHYVRKQTVANAERYVTEELADLERRVLSAQEKLIARETQLFNRLCDTVAGHSTALLRAGERIATLDCCGSLSQLAQEFDYVRPLVDDSEVLELDDARHPVVERMVEHGSFVPNDCKLDTDNQQILLITGPNMAGKSTYMRQVAQVVLLAQMGSFVPARSARIGLVDRIFTRVGAADNLARGESTFMVEMRETATILASATRRSLVVLDEVGRGTSTYDGVSIAWAVAEYLHDAIGARTLFATHYHELCRLADSRVRVHNVSVAVREHDGDIVFLRRVVPGGANRSYGIDVARLAGLPRSVISRGRQMLKQLEAGHLVGQSAQLGLFGAAELAPEAPVVETPVAPQSEDGQASGAAVVARLAEVDLNNTTPLQALTLLAELTAL